MKRLRLNLRRCVALLATLFVAVSPAAAQDDDRALRAEQQRARELERLRQAESSKQETFRLEKGVLAALDKLDRQIGKTRSDMRTTQGRIDGVEKNIETLQGEIAALVEQQQARKGLVGQRIRANYKLNYLSRNGLFGLAFRSDNIGDALIRLQYISKIREKDNEVIRSFFAAQQALASRKADLETRKAELERERQALAKQRDGLARDRRSRQSALEAVRADRTLHEQTIQELQKSIRAYENLIAELTKTRGDAASRASSRARRTVILGVTAGLELRGQYQAIPWPVGGTVVSNASEELEGVTIRAAEGSDVTAVMGGTVEYADWFEGLGFGKLVALNHGDGLRTFYAHLQEIRVAAKDRVEAGEIIGTVGSTGSLIGSVLYFEMRRQFDVINSTRSLR